MHITLRIDKHTENYSRWSITHEVFKNNILAAEIEVDGAWIDTVKRKLASPPEAIASLFQKINQYFPKHDCVCNAIIS